MPETSDVYLNEDEQKIIEKYFCERSQSVDTYPEYWVHGWEESISFCLECCDQQVLKLTNEDPEGGYRRDGWGFESDGPAFCETCEKKLEVNLTDYACEEELRHFDSYGVESDDGCHSMFAVIQSLGWNPSPFYGLGHVVEVPISDSRKHSLLHRICREVLMGMEVPHG